MPRVSYLTAEVRPEGGAVRLAFSLPSGFPQVLVLRLPAGSPAPDPQSPPPQAREVFAGQPEPGPPYRFIRNAAEAPLQRGQVWDLEAFVDGHDDEPNRIEGATWDYWVFPRGDSYGEGTRVTANIARTLTTGLSVNVKNLLYQRLRYHARAVGATVAQQEHLIEGQPLPQMLLKVRHALQERHASEERDRERSVRAVTYRVTADVLILADDPRERNALVVQLRERLLGDLWLLEELGWTGLTMSDADQIADKEDAVLYGSAFTLEGIVLGYVSIPHPYRIADELTINGES